MIRHLDELAGVAIAVGWLWLQPARYPELPPIAVPRHIGTITVDTLNTVRAVKHVYMVDSVRLVPIFASAADTILVRVRSTRSDDDRVRALVDSIVAARMRDLQPGASVRVAVLDTSPTF